MNSPGSSPLTRGRPARGLPMHHPRRLIPAHAGSTASTAGKKTAGRAHPRSRGVDRLPVLASTRRVGSSPLTRGRQCRTHGRTDQRGLIPAHAGSTCSLSSRLRWGAAHPRSRGVDCRDTAPAAGENGSSPLTRGRPLEPSVSVGVVGLIPAHAGSTASTRPTSYAATAHPRSRGVDACTADATAPQAGSSPLTRGRQPFLFDQWRSARLIPAHAGSTTVWRRRRCCR